MSFKSTFLEKIALTSDFPMGLEIEKARGTYIFTKDGKKYIDFISGIAVSTLGHCHPQVIQAIQEQITRHLHVMVYGEYIMDAQVEFAQNILNQLPAKFERIYFVNSGTEANEGALKLAKKFTGRTKLFAFRNSYHGDTHGSLSVTGRNVYRDPYLPLLPNVHFFDFNGDDILNSIDETVAAVIMEPIQGEGGIIPSNSDWLNKLRNVCNENGTLLIFDEIQSGFGRTGKFFAFEHYGVEPDILCMAKAMGGGMPIGGFAASSEIFSVFRNDPPLNHVTTFGGHPVSCAAGNAALNVLLSENLMANASAIEEMTKNILKADGVVEVRGFGAMLGLELRDKDMTEKVVGYCFEHGLILGWTLHSNTLVRLAPPLSIPKTTLKSALNLIKTAIQLYK